MRQLTGLTIERTMQIVLFALVFALAARVPVDTDVWWHLRSGEYTLTQGMITRDPFSYTFAEEPWINHSWGSQIILYGVYSLGGLLGLTIYMAGLATGGMIVLYAMARGSSYLRAFTIILGSAAAAIFWSPRPQMISFFLSAVILYLLITFQRGGRDRLWLIPPLMALWGNLHAGFAIGFIFMGGVIAGSILDRLFNPTTAPLAWAGIGKLIAISAIAVVALVINPYGLAIYAVPFETLGIGALRAFIQEWNSPNFQGRETWAFLFLIFGIIAAAGGSNLRLRWTEAILVCGTAFMAFTAGRNIAVFVIPAVPVLSEHLDAILRERGWVFTPMRRVAPRLGLVNAILIGVVLLGAAVKTLAVLDEQTAGPAFAAALPIDAVAYMRDQGLDDTATVTLLNSYNWGGYLIHALPTLPVFVDGRTDLYGDVFLTRYLQIASGGTDWREGLDDYAISHILIERDSGLARRLRDEAGWRTLYEDETATLFARGAA